MALVVQSFGNEREYRRAVFTILSYYAHHTDFNPQRTILYTDNPTYFQPWFKNIPVQFELLTSAGMKEMRGRHDFLHRMKIAIIEDAFKKTAENILYVDSDTFFTGNTDHLFHQLSPDKNFMHVKEYDFNSLLSIPLPAGKPFHDFVNHINHTRFLKEDGIFIEVNSQQHSWNAGVMMLHRSVTAWLPEVYALTEQFYPATRNHASEQYAFSIVLQNHSVLYPCNEAVYHYWYRVKKDIIDIFLAGHITANRLKGKGNLKYSDILTWTRTLPSRLDNHVWTLRDNAIQQFNMDHFSEAYRWSIRALLKSPFNIQFLRDLVYHTRRYFSEKHTA